MRQNYNLSDKKLKGQSKSLKKKAWLQIRNVRSVNVM